jgi:hypothetical protein
MRSSFLPSAHTAETPWQTIRRHKHQAAASVAGGAIIAFSAKYIAAALLVLWLLTGGQ